jgi:hypothetical protein
MSQKGKEEGEGVQVYEIRVAGEDPALKDRIAQLLCPDENHAPPCPVPWSFGYAENGLVVAICTTPEKAGEVVERVRALTPATLAEVAPADHEDLVEQFRVESRLR